MILDSDEILKAVAIAKIKGVLATLVWEMQLENFNAKILDIVADDIYAKLDKLKDPVDINCAQWQAALEKECERYLCHDTKPVLAILPWFDKLTGPDYQIISNMAVGGMRHTPLHIRISIGIIKSKIENGAVASKIASSGNKNGSLDWFLVAQEVKKGAPEEKIIDKLRVAIAYEVEAINR